MKIPAQAHLNILILTQFYAPEFGAASVRLSRLARLLAADGHNVTVLTAMPNYPDGVIAPAYRGKIFHREQVDGVTIERVWLYASPKKNTISRLLNQFSFTFMAALRGTFLSRPAALLVESHPLFVCLTGGWLKRIKRAPIVLNVSDLWPESAVATGALRADSAIVKIAEKVERWAYHDATHVVGMTEGVVEGINAVLQQPVKVSLIQNAVDVEKFNPQVDGQDIRQMYGLGERCIAIHVGNMSLTYDFDLLLDCATALPEIAFLFVGDGSQGEYVRRQVQERGLENVTMTGVVPHDMMPVYWGAADIALIALRDHSVAGGTRPAKMFEAMATGTPIVAAIRGEGATLLRESGAGIPVAVGDLNSMVNALRLLASEPAQRLEFSVAGRAYAEQHLDPQRVKERYLTLLKQAASQD